MRTYKIRQLLYKILASMIIILYIIRIINKLYYNKINMQNKLIKPQPKNIKALYRLMNNMMKIILNKNFIII